MTLELDGQKVVVSGRKGELDRTVAEDGAGEGADVAIWMREWKGDVNKLKQLLLSTADQRNLVTYLTLARGNAGAGVLLVAQGRPLRPLS